MAYYFLVKNKLWKLAGEGKKVDKIRSFKIHPRVDLLGSAEGSSAVYNDKLKVKQVSPVGGFLK